uniref:Mortality factor 4 like 1 n=1 Tax=Mus musculus TaxID=10090 RepID=A0A087WSL1_MOUSE
MAPKQDPKPKFQEVGMNGCQKAEYSNTWTPICRNSENFKRPIRNNMQRAR